MCLVCRRRFSKKDMLRFVADEKESLCQDRKYRLKGRGVYCCRTEECLGCFAKQAQRLAKSLRCPGVKVDIDFAVEL